MSLRFKINAREIKKLKELVESLQKPINKTTASEVGETVIKEMKDLISKGISPIQGNSRFPAYKYPKKYPGKRKGKRPVNLKLTGQFLDALSHKEKDSKSGVATEVFYEGSESKKELGHREGVNSQPKRPTLPIDGEDFAVKIKRKILKIYEARLRELIRGKR